MVRHINYYKQISLINELVDEGKAVLVLPSRTIQVSRFKGTVEKSAELYNLGYKDMENRKEEIMAFLSKGEEE